MSITRALLLALSASYVFAQPLTVSGSFRTRSESWDYFDSGYTFSGSTFRFAISQSRENFTWNTEFAIPVLINLPNAATGGAGANYFTANARNSTATSLFAKQAWVQWKGAAGQLRLGRMEYADGSETTPKNATLAALKASRINMRLLGHFGWTHVGRSFDGLLYQKTSAKNQFTFLSAIPTRGVFQTDGWGWNKAAFGYAAYTKPWGSGAHSADTRVFALYYQDWRANVVKTDNRSLAARRLDSANLAISTFGGHSVHAFESKPATYDILLWGAVQTGRWGVQSHRAFAYTAEAGAQPHAAFTRKLKPWIRAGYGQSSGDGDPNDRTHNTFFQVLPTPRPFARFPFFNMMNNRDIYTGLTLRPHARLSVSTEFHGLSLANRNDLWYQGGGVFQPWTFGYAGRNTSGARSLANLYDASVDIKVTKSVGLNLYYGHAQGLAAINTFYPKDRSGNFGYIEMMYKF